jgi:hypothetical protein
MRWVWPVAVLVLLFAGIAGGEEEKMGEEERSRRVREHELATYSADCMACNALQVGSIPLAAPISQPPWLEPSLSPIITASDFHTSHSDDEITFMIHAASAHTVVQSHGTANQPTWAICQSRRYPPLTRIPDIPNSRLVRLRHVVFPTASSTYHRTAPSPWTRRARSSASC